MVHIVAQEEIIVPYDVSSLVFFRWRFPQLEEPHQVIIVSMDISKDFGWWLEVDHSWLSLEHLGDFSDKPEYMIFVDGERLHQ